MAKATGRKAGNNRPRSKSEVFSELSSLTGTTRKQVAQFFDALTDLIKRDLKKGPGLFTVPGLMKIKVVHKPATKARQGINPFTKEPMLIKAKPARKVVRVVPLKGLKAMV